jgi:hypothetical protein
MNHQSQIEELIDFIIDCKDDIDVNDILIKAELINMRSKPRQVGWYYNGKLYSDLDELKGRTISESNKPKPLYYYS